ncbi:MAG: restriction endonuclease subunit S [Flavobacteriales bacterium]|nr:restriction endonuclease subunit S [Flavobacteriales bacterium]
MKLLAAIDSGKSFRTKPEFVDGPDGVGLIQMKDVSPSGVSSNLMKIDRNDVNTDQLLQNGDVLFVAKGNNNFAVTFWSSDPAVAASFFFVIRPDMNQIHPEYLTWYINSSPAQQYFEQHRMGATVGNIRKKVIEDLSVPLPDISTQVKIESIYGLWEREKETTQKLLEQKERYYNNLLADIMTNKIKTKSPEDISPWVDIWIHSNYYPAHVKLKSPIVIGEEEVSELVCTFNQMERKSETFHQPDGSTLTVLQVSGWDFILLKDLRSWNDPQIPQPEKTEKYLKHISHAQVAQIELRDKLTGKIILQKENL